jgi:hemoglobin-like flavoprotein
MPFKTKKSRGRRTGGLRHEQGQPCLNGRLAQGKVISRRHAALLRCSFSEISAQGSIAGLVFYQKLFTSEPALRELFHTSVELQTRKLMETLNYTVATLEQPKALVPMLEGLGRRHLMYGAREDHYDMVIHALLETFKEVLGDRFTDEVHQAWRQALTFVANTMKRAAGKVDAELRIGGAARVGRGPRARTLKR